MSQNAKNILLGTAADNQSVKSDEIIKTTHTENSNGEFYGDALNDSNINDVITNIIPELIVLVGFAGYGKSTLVGSLHHYLLLGNNIGGYKLIDSDTFAGFERRIALRRLTGENLNCATKRTLRGEYYFLTLDLANDKNHHKIIISDKSGETYNDYKDKKVEAQNDLALFRANYLLLLIDSQDLFEITKRNKTEDAIYDLIGNIQKNKETNFCVLFTKIDLIKEKDRATFNSMCDGIVIKIEEAIGKPITNRYFIDSKKVPNHADNIEGSIIEIFNDILKLTTSKSKINKRLNWIDTLLK